MILSDEQMRAVRHGEDNPATWQWVDLPVGPQPLPTWAKGFDVDFMMDYCNSPHYTIKSPERLYDWPNKVFRQEGSRYMAESGDGRAVVYYHQGAISEVPIRRFRAADGILRQYRKCVVEGGWRDDQMEPGDWVDVPMMATTQQQGFGGAHYDLTMEDGRTVVLRGPWHGGAPAGFVEVASTHGGGVFITDDLFMKLLARFCPEMRCARISDKYGSRLQAVRGDWDCPKDWLPRQRGSAHDHPGD